MDSSYFLARQTLLKPRFFNPCTLEQQAVQNPKKPKAAQGF
jgi:hypothetical protein